MGEAQEVEGPRTLRALAPITASWRLKRHDTRFVRMQRQTETTQALAEGPPHPLHIFMTRQHDYEVIRVTDQITRSVQPWTNLIFEPRIHDVV